MDAIRGMAKKLSRLEAEESRLQKQRDRALRRAAAPAPPPVPVPVAVPVPVPVAVPVAAAPVAPATKPPAAPPAAPPKPAPVSSAAAARARARLANAALEEERLAKELGSLQGQMHDLMHGGGKRALETQAVRSGTKKKLQHVKQLASSLRGALRRGQVKERELEKKRGSAKRTLISVRAANKRRANELKNAEVERSRLEHELRREPASPQVSARAQKAAARALRPLHGERGVASALKMSRSLTKPQSKSSAAARRAAVIKGLIGHK